MINTISKLSKALSKHSKILTVMVVISIFSSLVLVNKVDAEVLKNANNVANASNPSTNISQEDKVELEIEHPEGTNSEEIKTTFNNLDFTQINLESSFALGSFTQTEFIGRTKIELLAGNLDSEISLSRSNFLENQQNIERKNKQSGLASKYDEKDIEKAISEVKNSKPKFAKSKIILSRDKAKKFEQDDSNSKKKGIKNKVKSLKIQEIKRKEKANQNEVETKSKTSNDAIGQTISKVVDGLSSLVSPVSVQAQSAAPSWVPKQSETYFFDSDEWQSLNRSTLKGYSITGHRDSLCASHTGLNTTKTYFSCSVYGDKFTNWIEATGDTTSAPVIFSAFNRLYQMIHGIDSGIYIRYTLGNYDQSWSWTPWKRLGGLTTSTPAMAFTGTSLCLMHRGTNNGIYQTCSNDGWNFPGWQQTDGWTIDAPVMAFSNGRLYQGHRGLYNNLYTRFSVDGGNTFTSWRDVGRTSDQSFSMTNFFDGTNLNLCLLHKGNGQDRQMYQGCTKDGNTWGAWNRAIGETINAPATTQTLGKIWWAHRGTDNNMYLKYSNSASGTRGYYSYMLWENPGFGYYDTYEQDIHLWNGDNISRKTYMDKTTSGFPDCIQSFRYISSSLPNAYLDTRLDQNGTCNNVSNEVSFTIGSGQASAIRSNFWYSNYMETFKGDRDRPVFAISAQLGERRPEWCGFRDACIYFIGLPCYTTWCSWPTRFYQFVNYDTTLLLNRNQTYPYWAVKYQK
jgi:hypothetical protein